jgi:hypothetical protein
VRVVVVAVAVILLLATVSTGAGLFFGSAGNGGSWTTTVVSVAPAGGTSGAHVEAVTFQVTNTGRSASGVSCLVTVHHGTSSGSQQVRSTGAVSAGGSVRATVNVPLDAAGFAGTSSDAVVACSD